MTKPDRSRRIPPLRQRLPIDPRANLALARQREEDVPPANRTRWQAYRSVLEAAGIDPATLTWDGQPYNAATVRGRWVEPHAPVWDALAAEVPGHPPLEQARWKPVFALGYALRRLLGLNHHLIGGHTRKHVRYAVDSATLEQQRERTTHAED